MLKKYGVRPDDAGAEAGGAMTSKFRAAGLRMPTDRDAERAEQAARSAMRRILPTWASDVLELRRRGVLEARWDEQGTGAAARAA